MYYGTASTIAFLVALFLAVPLGLFLCRYSVKSVVISIIGLTWVTVYLSESAIGVANVLELTGRKPALYLLEYAVPAAFFAAGTLAIVRCGLYVWSRHGNGAERPPGLELCIEVGSAPGQTVESTPGWRTLLRWFARKENVAVCLIAAAVLAVHLMYIANPPSHGTATGAQTPNFLGDEGYYVPAAEKLLNGQGLALPEHPPLGKSFIAAGIFIFGDNAAGWRAFPVLFAVAAVFIFYFVCRALVGLEPVTNAGDWGAPRRPGQEWSLPGVFVPLFATFLFAFENMSFVMGHVAMLDVFYVTLMLLGFLFYLRGNYLSCGVVMGLSVLCKATALLGLLAIVLHWAITRRHELALDARYTWNALKNGTAAAPRHSEIVRISSLLVAVPVVWSMLLVILEYPANHRWANPIERGIYMLTTHLRLTDTYLASGTVTPEVLESVTKPWTWLLSPSTMVFNHATQATQYVSSIGWTVWSLAIPAIAYLIFVAFRHRSAGRAVAAFALCWFIAVYGLLIFIELLTGRLMYNFYLYPAVPAVCVAIAWGAWRLWEAARKGRRSRVVYRAVLAVYTLATLAAFIAMSPLGTKLVKLG